MTCSQKPSPLPHPVGYSSPCPAVTLAHHSRVPSFPPETMACSLTCARFLGLSLGTSSLFAAGANIALLFPNWDVTYLMRGLVGKHAMLGSGLWGGGLMVCVLGSVSGNSRSLLLGMELGGGVGVFQQVGIESINSPQKRGICHGLLGRVNSGQLFTLDPKSVSTAVYGSQNWNSPSLLGLFILMCMGVLTVCTYVYRLGAGTFRGQKRVSYPLELQ